MNALLQNVLDRDVVVKFDNDCELTQPDTLKAACERSLAEGWLLSPRINGLNNPPKVIDRHGDLEETASIGGCFMAIPSWVFNTWRFDEKLPVWGGDDIGICKWFRSLGGHVGYLRDYVANHYETTNGQHERYPAYFARSAAEGSPV